MEIKKLFPDEIVYETKYWKVAQDWEVAIVGFYIVSPKRKIHSIQDLNDEESIDLINTMRKVRKAMSIVLGINDVYIFHNEDSPYGFHIWMLPWHSWMEKIGRGPSILVPVWKYAKDNFNDENSIKEVKEAAVKVRKYISEKLN